MVYDYKYCKCNKCTKIKQTLIKVDNFKYKMKKTNNQEIRGTILNLVAKNRQVIYGQQSVNYFLPQGLKRKTKDIDILTKKPKQSAEELVRELNKKFNGDRFKVKEALHRGTFKVKDTKTKETIADYTGTTKKPKSYKLFGVRFAKEGYQLEKIRKSLKNPEASYRHKKDLDTLERIKKARQSLNWR